MASKPPATSPRTPDATPDRQHRPPDHRDSILESLGKAITDPVREASEKEHTHGQVDTAEPADRAARRGH